MKKELLYILTIFMMGCSPDKQLLRQSVEHFRADGGVYLSYDMQKDEIFDKQVVSFDLRQMYQPDFSKIGINKRITAEQLLREYVGKIKNNADLQEFLRQNVLSGEAKKVNIQDVEISGLTATTPKNQNGLVFWGSIPFAH